MLHLRKWQNGLCIRLDVSLASIDDPHLFNVLFLKSVIEIQPDMIAVR